MIYYNEVNVIKEETIYDAIINWLNVEDTKIRARRKSFILEIVKQTRISLVHPMVSQFL